MSGLDWIGLFSSYTYAFGILTLFEALGKKMEMAQFVTRKLTHVFAGLWVWGVLILFEHKLPGLVPFASFIVLNYVFYRKQTYGHMDSKDSSPGTVYFAFSITFCMAVFWKPDGPVDHVPIAMAAIMAMTVGDALAALIGRYAGHYSYRIWNATKTVEGTAAMFLSSVIVILVCLWFIPGSTLAPLGTVYPLKTVLWVSFAGAAAAAGIEALSLKGLDNFTVPVGTAALLYALLV